MKKKQIAVLLAALLSVSPAAEGVAVMGADFSAGEGTSEAVEVQMEKEESTEDATPETEPVMETGEAEGTDTEEVWTSGEEEVSEFETGEEEQQQDVFVEEPSKELTQSAEASVSKGTYEVAYITEEQYNECLNGEDRPDVELKTIEDTTLTDALGKLEGENTGYCLVLPHDVEGAEDIVVPEGMNVYVGFADGMLVKSIKPNGNIAFRGIGNGEDNIEIKEGNGTVTFRQLYMTGTLTGTGSNDTVIFSRGDATLGGISGIENVHFGNDFWNLNIKGKSEFYNLYNDTGHDEESIPAWIQIEGYSKETVPVFHKEFDWGTGNFKNEEGDSWSGNYRLGISYKKSFEGDDWSEMELSSGSQVVTFDMPLEDVIGLGDRLYVSQEGYDSELSLNGKIWDCNENKLYRIYRYQDADGKTAQELFENDHMDNFECPEGGDYFLGGISDINQMLQVIETDQKKNKTAGYYNVDLTKNGVIDTLDIPSGIKGINFWGVNDYDEKTDTRIQYPVKIGSVKTQAGQTVRLGHALVNSGLSVSGEGIVQIQDCVIQGTLKGAGANDTVTFIQDSVLGGLSGVENVHFGKQCGSLNLRGAAEFYNIYNDTGSEANEQFPVGIQIEGKDASRTVTFHKPFDWGIGNFSNEEGDHWTAPYSLVIRYYKSFDEEDWEFINPGTGFQSVKFNMSDSDIIDMVNRVAVHAPEIVYDLDMDGKTWCNEGNGADIEICQSTEGQSAQELFDAYGKREFSEEGLSWLTAMPSTGQASRYLTAYQKKNNAEGYYIVHIGQKAEVTDTLTVPDGVNAVKYAGHTQHDEKTDTERYFPIKISSVNAPAGKIIVLMNMLVKTDNITIKGEGMTELLNSRFNANVTADKLQVHAAAVKSLNCNELVTTDGSRLVVSEYLKFNKATLAPETVIYGQPGAYLNMGEMNSTESDLNSNPDFFLGNDGKAQAQIYFGGKLNLGKFNYDGTEYLRRIMLWQFDVQAAKKAGALCTKDCFSDTYNYDWYDNDTDNWWNYQCSYQNEEYCIATISNNANVDDVLDKVIVRMVVNANGEENTARALPRYLYLDEFKNLTDGINGDRRAAFYVNYWDDEENAKAVEIPYYFRIADSPATSISSAKISDIKTQLYAGKAVTPSVTVTLNGKKLKAGTDYTVSYTNNTKAGATATVTVVGKGNYTGAVTQNFKIAAVPAKGKVYTVGNLKYKVTKSAYKNGTVSVSAPAKKTLTSVSVPATVKIGGYTFNVTAIGDKAFNGCTKLKKVTIGSKVTTIGKQAFNGCKVLTSITISSKVLKTVGSSALKGISAKAVIKVPAAKLTVYQKLLKGKGQKASVKIKK